MMPTQACLVSGLERPTSTPHLQSNRPPPPLPGSSLPSGGSVKTEVGRNGDWGVRGTSGQDAVLLRGPTRSLSLCLLLAGGLCGNERHTRPLWTSRTTTLPSFSPKTSSSTRQSYFTRVPHYKKKKRTKTTRSRVFHSTENKNVYLNGTFLLKV